MLSLTFTIVASLIILVGAIAFGKGAIKLTAPSLLATLALMYFGFSWVALTICVLIVLICIGTSINYLKAMSSNPRATPVFPLLLNGLRGSGWLILGLVNIF